MVVTIEYNETASHERRVKGYPGAPGIAIGPAWVIDPEIGKTSTRTIREDEVEAEWGRFQAAVAQALQQLQRVERMAQQRNAAEAVDLFRAYALFVQDRTFAENVRHHIADLHENAEAAVAAVVEKTVTLFEELDNVYLRERAQDVREAGRRLVFEMRANDRPQQGGDRHDVVLCGRELPPPDLLQRLGRKPLALCSELGSNTAHTTILAESLGLPAVIGIDGLLDLLSPGETVIVDGDRGLVVIDPLPTTIQLYTDEIRRRQQREQRYLGSAHRVGLTEDGRRVRVLANIATSQEVAPALTTGAEGIGLFRTEFLFQAAKKEQLPSEEEQLAWYRAAVSAAHGSPVTIRLIDAGSDKPIPGIRLPNEQNPALGLRGVRLLRAYPQLLHTQLRALLRAASYGPVQILVPMVTDMDEWLWVREQVERTLHELQREGLPAAPAALGVMVETPACALCVDLFAETADFFSLGTNDLAQYLTASDRAGSVKEVDPFSPALLRTIAAVVRAAHQADKEVVVCGELAASRHPQATCPFWSGWG
ncbi:MAG: phosphoenolpyruvate--protein phosphotransferase [Firmicutes bacterium]|nr:phosphoenolpyruvate--protein phosphotransferase [Bacillota bacterium]